MLWYSLQWRQVTHLACRAGPGYAGPGPAPGLFTADSSLVLLAVLEDPFVAGLSQPSDHGKT
jgi:hypothetical protein